jgi:eukaryotic-like serine/threonine-protein kinase
LCRNHSTGRVKAVLQFDASEKSQKIAGFFGGTFGTPLSCRVYLDRALQKSLPAGVFLHSLFRFGTHPKLDLPEYLRNINSTNMAVLFTIDGNVHYDIVRKIYEGGMGIVYEAEQRGAHGFVKRVAIKVIRKHFAKQKQFLENFFGEAKLVADLIHTNIVQTYHLGEGNGSYYIAMELIRGANLEQFSEQLAVKERLLPLELAVFIASRVVRGLAYAHAKTDKDGRPLGIVHRDVSFKNIMIAYEGDVKLSDFGIAKARGFLVDNEGEVVAGKADFMSPEQADFQITDKRSDLFSVGVVLAHLILGYNIFKGPTPEESRKNIMQMPLPDFRKLDKRIDAELNSILHCCLARDIGQRYPIAYDLLYALENYIYHAGYGPTNETLGKLMRELFDGGLPPTPPASKDNSESSRSDKK